MVESAELRDDAGDGVERSRDILASTSVQNAEVGKPGHYFEGMGAVQSMLHRPVEPEEDASAPLISTNAKAGSSMKNKAHLVINARRQRKAAKVDESPPYSTLADESFIANDGVDSDKVISSVNKVPTGTGSPMRPSKLEFAEVQPLKSPQLVPESADLTKECSSFDESSEEGMSGAIDDVTKEAEVHKELTNLTSKKELRQVQMMQEDLPKTTIQNEERIEAKQRDSLMETGSQEEKSSVVMRTRRTFRYERNRIHKKHPIQDSSRREDMQSESPQVRNSTMGATSDDEANTTERNEDSMMSTLEEKEAAPAVNVIKMKCSEKDKDLFSSGGSSTFDDSVDDFNSMSDAVLSLRSESSEKIGGDLAASESARKPVIVSSSWDVEPSLSRESDLKSLNPSSSKESDFKSLNPSFSRESDLKSVDPSGEEPKPTGKPPVYAKKPVLSEDSIDKVPLSQTSTKSKPAPRSLKIQEMRKRYELQGNKPKEQSQKLTSVAKAREVVDDRRARSVDSQQREKAEQDLESYPSTEEKSEGPSSSTSMEYANIEQGNNEAISMTSGEEEETGSEGSAILRADTPASSAAYSDSVSWKTEGSSKDTNIFRSGTPASSALRSESISVKTEGSSQDTRSNERAIFRSDTAASSAPSALLGESISMKTEGSSKDNRSAERAVLRSDTAASSSLQGESISARTDGSSTVSAQTSVSSRAKAWMSLMESKSKPRSSRELALEKAASGDMSDVTFDKTVGSMTYSVQTEQTEKARQSPVEGGARNAPGTKEWKSFLGKKVKAEAAAATRREEKKVGSISGTETDGGSRSTHEQSTFGPGDSGSNVSATSKSREESPSGTSDAGSNVSPIRKLNERSTSEPSDARSIASAIKMSHVRSTLGTNDAGSNVGAVKKSYERSSRDKSDAGSNTDAIKKTKNGDDDSSIFKFEEDSKGEPKTKQSDKPASYHHDQPVLTETNLQERLQELSDKHAQARSSAKLSSASAKYSDAPSESTYSEDDVSSESDKGSTGVAKGSFLDRLQACAAPIIPRPVNGDSDSVPLAHLAFLKTNPSVAPASGGGGPQNSMRKFMPPALCGRPDTIFEEPEDLAEAEEKEARKNRRSPKSSPRASPRTSPRRNRSSPKPTRPKVSSSGSDLSGGNVGHKTAYLEAIAMKAAVADVPKERNFGSVASAATSSRSTHSSEAWQGFLERRRSRSSSSVGSNGVQKNAAVKVEEMMHAMSSETTSNGKDRRKKVDEMIDTLSTTSSSSQQNLVKRPSTASSERPRSRGRAKKSESAKAAEELAAARVEAMMAAMSSANIDEGEI